MKHAIVIPARFQSSRLPGKPLVEILGKTLIQRVWERCCEVLGAGDVYVATDDERIRDHGRQLGMQVIMTPADCATGTDRICLVAEQIGADSIINVQGDEPLILPQDVRAVMSRHEQHPDRVQCGMCPIANEEDFKSPSVPKVVVDKDGMLLYMSRAAIPTTKQLTFERSMKQVCIYAYSPESLRFFADCYRTQGGKSPLESLEDIEILRFAENRWPVEMVVVSDTAIAVDTPDDVERVCAVLRAHEAD